MERAASSTARIRAGSRYHSRRRHTEPKNGAADLKVYDRSRSESAICDRLESGRRESAHFAIRSTGPGVWTVSAGHDEFPDPKCRTITCGWHHDPSQHRSVDPGSCGRRTFPSSGARQRVDYHRCNWARRELLHSHSELVKDKRDLEARGLGKSGYLGRQETRGNQRATPADDSRHQPRHRVPGGRIEIRRVHDPRSRQSRFDSTKGWRLTK